MNKRYASNKGFSLVELTVVMLIITLLASVAVRETSELAFQTRYEQTRERLDMIKQAILGNPRQIINGQQAISGFVADMGRLPDNLRELVQMGFCVTAGASDPPTAAQVVTTVRKPEACIGTDVWRWTNAPCTDGVSGFAAACTGGGHLWLAKQADIATNTGLSFGWDGPYLTISGNPADIDAFTDGWGRVAQGYCNQVDYTDQAACETNGFVWTPAENDYNYGWYMNQITEDNLTLLSYGKDYIYADAATGYDVEYPALIAQPVIQAADWMIDISAGIGVNVAKQYDANKLCGFGGSAAYTTQADCENAGGTWSTSCTFEENSCKSVGGTWNDCLFEPVACTAPAVGGTFQMHCQFSQKSCDAAGGAGSWDTNSGNTTYRTCLIDSDQTKCTNVGGSWNTATSKCDFNESSCLTVGGAWISDCNFDSTTCPTGTAGVAWVATNKPDSCNFTKAACTSLNGLSLGDNYCYMSHRESVGEKYNAASCDNATGGTWSKKICMKVFYRESATVDIQFVMSNVGIGIDETGSQQTVLFTFTSPTWIPIGQNAIGIYEHDGTNCTNTPYPADRQKPIQVDFRPHTTLPVINW